MNCEAELCEIMGTLFYFCLKKTGDANSAEELSQDILASALSSLKSAPPRDFYPWFWQIARRRYSRWADARHKKAEHEAGADIADSLGEGIEPISEEATPEEMLIRSDELSRLRRELAFISREYRELIVGYYLEDLSVKQLASRFSLQCEAVKSRLLRARKKLKEGMDMAREFGIRSYKPEEISFVNNGIGGELGQPWNVLTHSMYKNIFLEVYGNPETAEQLAIELGIALPYMEDELEFLVRETFLKKENGKYETTFAIIGREVQRKIHEKSTSAADKLTTLLCAYVDRVFGENPELYGGNVDYKDAKWALLMWAADIAYRNSRSVQAYERTKRPSKGCWDIIGYQSTDFDEPPFVGQHGVLDRNGRDCVNFSQFKFKYRNICNISPEHLSFEEGEALKAIALGEACDMYCAEKLIDYGYVRRDGDRLAAAVCVVGSFPETSELEEAAKLFGEANRSFAALIEAELPASIRADECQRSLACSATVERGYIAMEAIKRGWLVYDETSARSIGAIMQL